MNSPDFSDPQLQSLEAQLAAGIPRLAPAEQAGILYACAFGAGQRSARRSVRRWQAASGLLSLLLLGLSVPMARDQIMAKKESPQPPAIEQPVASPVIRQEPDWESEVALSMRPAKSVKLDAWQVPDEPPAQRLAKSPTAEQSNTWTAGQLWRAELF